MITKVILAGILTVGVVDQINQDSATIEYHVGEEVKYSTVSLKNSDCTPREGDRVRFIPDQKIYLCESGSE